MKIRKRYFINQLFNILLILSFVTYYYISPSNEIYYSSLLLIDFEAIKEWFLGLGAKYNVNPWIFGGIYVGAIPFFTISIGRLISNYKKKKSIVLPAISAGFFFISAYIYLIIAGENVPFWVYGFVLLLVIYGVYSTIKKIKKQIGENEI